MAFRIPTFNLLCNVWTNSAIPPPGAPRLANLPCQITPDKVVVTGVSGGPIKFVMLIKVSARTDLRGTVQSTGTDLIELPAGSGVYYTVYSVSDVARGFPNEYRQAAAQLVAGPTPLP
jgi:hypothetical protein